PNVVTQGLSYTFDVTGSNFVQGATVQLSGAQSGAVQVVSSTELKVTATIQSAGMLALNVNNPFPFGAPTRFQFTACPARPPPRAPSRPLSGAPAPTAAATPSSPPKPMFRCRTAWRS